MHEPELQDELLRTEAVTNQHREQSNVNLRAVVRDRQLHWLPIRGVCAAVALLTIPWAFWGQSSHEGLIAWSFLVLVAHAAWPLAVLLRGHRHWLRSVAALQVLESVAWGALPVFALPDDPAWQTMQGGILLAFIVGTLAHSTAFSMVHLAATVPLTLIGSVALFVNGEGPAPWFGLALPISCGFTIASGAMLRAIHQELLETTIANAKLNSAIAVADRRRGTLEDDLELTHERLHRAMRSDSVTGLPNETEAYETLRDRLRLDVHGTTAVVEVVIDDFDRIAVAQGRRIAQILLRRAGQRLSEMKLPNVAISRSPGNGFLVITEAHSTAEVIEVGQRVVADLTRPYLIDNRTVAVTASVGLAEGRAAASPIELLRSSEHALAAAMRLGGNGVQLYDPAPGAEATRTASFADQIRLALRTREIIAYYQPIVDLNDGTIVAVEALARWMSNERLVAAKDFIDTVEELGLLIQLNTVVADAALQLQRELELSGLPLLPIALNVSPQELEAMLDHLQARPAAGSVILEVSERHAFDTEHGRALVASARERHLSVVLDDFGVGYSSFQRALDLPIDGLKIDRTFVAALADPSAVAAVRSMVEFAAAVGVAVVAEGVETQDQVRQLQELGVTRAQGHFFSDAISSAALKTELRSPGSNSPNDSRFYRQ